MHTTAVPGRTPALEPTLETISPELVLIDPELRRRALESLRSPRPPELRLAAPVPASPPRGFAPPRVEAQQTPVVVVRSVGGARRRYVVPLVAVVTAAVALAIAQPTMLDGPSSSKRPTVTPSRSTPHSVDHESIATVSSKQPAAQDLAPSAGRRTPMPVANPSPKWTFVWPARQAADYYNVTFFQGTRAVFEAWPRRPRLVVPARGTSRGHAFRFGPGRYRWVVRPGFGPRADRAYGKPIVVSTWTVAGTEPG
jgi:hypothetical protein